MNMLQSYMVIVTYRIDHETVAIRGAFKTQKLADEAIELMVDADRATKNDYDTNVVPVNGVVDLPV